MTEFVLPTTAGSIVSFEDWADVDQTEKFRYVVTLLPGHYEKGEFHNLVWSDSYGEDGGMNDVSAETILAGEPQLIFEAPAVNVTPVSRLSLEDERKYGTVLVLDGGWGQELVTFTPGAIIDGEMIDASWVNSYGGYKSQHEVENEAITRLVEGSDL